MRLLKVKAQGFKCFEDVKVELPEGGFTLLTGRNDQNPLLGANGVGKTTLFDAICWALYERTGKGLFATKLLARPRVGKGKGYSVELEFDNFKLKRTWSPNTLTLDGSSFSATNNEVVSRLRMNYDQFKLACYMHQGADHFVDLTPGEKLDFLSGAFQLDKWSERGEKAKALSKEAQQAAACSSSALNVLVDGLANAERRIDKADEQRQDWDQRKSEEKARLALQLDEVEVKRAAWSEEESLRYRKLEDQNAQLIEELSRAPDPTARDRYQLLESDIAKLLTSNQRSRLDSLRATRESELKRIAAVHSDFQKLCTEPGAKCP